MIFGEGPIIKNIAGDLNKLFLQGTRAGQPINNVEGDAAADQATIQLMADRDPVIRDISTGLGWAGREVTVSGTGALQLVNSLGRPLKSWRVEIAPYQEGSGYPSPDNVRPIHGTNKITIWTSGKNLCDNSTRVIQQSSQGAAISWMSSGILLKAGVTYTFSVTGALSAPNGIYIRRLDGQSSIAYAYNTNEIAATPYSDEMCYLYVLYNAGQTPDTWENIKGQLEIGSIATDFTPYVETTQTEINLPQTVYNTQVGNEVGINRNGIIIIDDSYNFEVNDSDSNSIVFRCASVVPQGTVTETYELSNLFRLDISANIISNYAKYNSFVLGQSGNLFIQLAIADYPDTAALKALLQSTPLQILYQLTTPTELTAISDPIPTTEGNSTIWVAAEDGIITSFSATYLQGE